MRNLFIKKLIFLLFISVNAFAQNGNFTFSIPSPVSTSAGVFLNDSILVRTLWNNVHYSPGTYTKEWDGKDDFGNTLSSPASTYKIKILSNNVQYAWQGTIGNSSDNMTGASKYKGYSSIKSLAFNATYGYYCIGYSEGFSSLGKFNTSTPNVRNAFFSSELITGDVKHVATDGNIVYWAATDSYSPNNSFVFGTNVSNDAETSFPVGSSYAVTYGKTYSSVISKINSSNSGITGLAVSSSYLFVARGGLNSLYVLNKTTGAAVSTIPFANVRGLCVDGADKLWVLHSTNTIQRYTINSDGSLTAVSTLSGPIAALSISYGNGLIGVCDGSSSQQVKFYDYSTGAATSTLGTAGGYQSDATVNNSKFYFTDARTTYESFVAWQPDNSFWVGDVGNSRAQHYSSSSVFINRIAFLGPSYSTWVDKNNINRAFVRYLEFDIDYSVQTLTGSTGWSLAKNWGATVSPVYNDTHDNMKPITLSNGRTYTLMQAGVNMELVELVSGGTMRFTGINKTTHVGSWFLCTDGSLQLYRELDAIATYSRYPLTGFDGLNNPTWSTTPEILATAKIDDSSPTAVGNPVAPTKNQIFSPTTNKVVLYNYKLYSNNVGPVISTGYHLGLMHKGANNAYLFQTEKSTHRNYQGPFPQPGWFEIGNKVSDFAGGNVNIVDRNIITSYHGEFWKDAQTNMYNHYYDNGLAIGQFGTTRPETSGQSASKMAGNALTPIVVKDGNGDLYLYHGDESDHSALHRWKISGLNTVKEQVVTIPFPSNIAPPTEYVDLMAGLPFSTTLPDNTSGWTRNPATDYVGTFGDNWRINTSMLKYDKQSATDLYIEFARPTGSSYFLTRDLGTNSVTTSWKISGNVNFGNMLNGLGNNVYMEVLDADGKLLTTFYALNDHILPTKFVGNTIQVLESNIPGVKYNTSTAFDISIDSGVVNFTYGGYKFSSTTISDASGNWRTPKLLRFRFSAISGMPNFDLTYDVSDLKFYKDYSANAINGSNLLPAVNPANPVNGLDYKYYEGTWSVLPDFSALNPVKQGTSSNFDLSHTNRADQYGFSFTGYIDVPADGQYTFYTSSDDGSNLYIDNVLTVSNDGLHGEIEKSGTIGLKAGKHAITGLFFQQGGGQVFLVSYEGAGISKQPIPSSALFRGASNKAPTADAGADQMIMLPTSAVTLAGNGTDTDGSISSHSWQKLSGPSSGSITIATPANTIVNNLEQGTYQFELTVTDNNGATGKDIIQVIVNAATTGNLLPAANPANFENGLDYKYYEGIWNVLPNFTALSPIKTGTSSKFDLSLANRPDQYGFSFTGYINIPADGQYTFYTTSDDGSSLYIDNVLTVSNDGLHGAEEKSGTIGLKAGKHAITGLFFQQGGGQVFTVSYAGMGITKQAIPSSALFRVSSSLAVINPENGLNYKYYEGNWTMLPNFSTLNPIKTGTSSNFDLKLANRPDQYGFSFTGYINIQADGLYTFYTTSDDGSSLYIDDVLTVSNDGLHGADEKSGTVALKAGMHAITGLFFQQDGGQVFTVSYAGMGITKQAIPSSVLFRTSNNTVTSNLLPAVYPSNAVNGLDYKYYEGSWTVLPNFSALNPIKTGTTSNFDLSYANRPDQNGFSFTGYINVPADGQYTFYTTSDDGSNLYIDDVLTVANDGMHGAEEKSGTIGLKAGKHAITSLFFQQGGGQVFAVRYSSATVGIAKQTIPASALYRVNISGRSANPTSKVTSPNLGNTLNPLFATANGISVFPNPVRDLVNIEINAKDKNDHLSISVYNSVGVLVKNIQLSTNQATTLHKLNLSGLANGYYSIVVRFNNGQQISSRIVKVKD